MAKWGISKRGKRYYNLRDGDGQFTDDGIPNGSIPSLSDVAQARVANTLRNSAGFRKPSNKDKTASTTRFTGAKSSKIDSRGEAQRLNHGRDAQAEENEKNARIAREQNAGSAKAAKPPVAGLPDFTEEAKKPASSFERKVLRDLGDAQEKGIIGKSGLTPQQKQMRDAGMNAEGRDRMLVADADKPQKLKKKLSELDNAELNETMSRLDSYMANTPERMDMGKLMEARDKISAERNRRRDNGQTADELAKQNPDDQVRPKRPQNLAINRLLDRVEGLTPRQREGHLENVKRTGSPEERKAAEQLLGDSTPLPGEAWEDPYKSSPPATNELKVSPESKAAQARSREDYHNRLMALTDKLVELEDGDDPKALANAREDIDRLNKNHPGAPKTAADRKAYAQEWASGALEAAPAKTVVAKNDGLVAGLKNAQAGWQKEEADRIARGWPAREDPFQAQIDNLQKPYEPEGKDARSMTAAEKLAAGRAMYGDKVSKQKGFNELQKAAEAESAKKGIIDVPESELDEQDITQARTGLLRATRSMGPKDRQAYYNDKATNGSTAQKVAAKSMGGRDLNAPGVGLPSTVGLSPERQRLEALRSANPLDRATRLDDAARDNPEVAKREEAAHAIERDKLLNEVLAVIPPTGARANQLVGDLADKGSGDPEWIRMTLNELVDQGRLQRKGLDTYAPVTGRGLPQKPGSPEPSGVGITSDPRKRSSIGAAIVATEKQITQLEQVMARGGLGAQERLKNQTRLNSLNDDLQALQKTVDDRNEARPSGVGRERAKADAEVARLEQQLDRVGHNERARTETQIRLNQAKRGAQQLRIAEQNEQSDRAQGLPKRAGAPRSVDLTSSAPGRENSAMERAANKVLDQLEKSNKVGVKSRPAVEYGSDYANMPPEKQKTYRSKRRKLIDTAMEAGLPPEEIKRIFAQPMSSWPTADQLKKRRK